MRKFEYFILRRNIENIESTVRELDTLGEEGWELVNFIMENGIATFILKNSWVPLVDRNKK